MNNKHEILQRVRDGIAIGGAVEGCSTIERLSPEERETAELSVLPCLHCGESVPVHGNICMICSAEISMKVIRINPLHKHLMPDPGEPPNRLLLKALICAQTTPAQQEQIEFLMQEYTMLKNRYPADVFVRATVLFMETHRDQLNEYITTHNQGGL